MSFPRLLLVLVVLAAGYWLVTKAGLVGEKHDLAPATQSPLERARAAARTSDARNAQAEAAAAGALDSAPSGGNAVSENMTPDQVRSLLGAPDSVDSSTTDTGVAIEKWTYRSVGKTVVFENGIVARVE